MTWECWKCGTSVSSDHPPTKIEGVDRYICDHCNADSAEAELTRLREENARLREALQECVTDEGAVGFTGARYAKRRLRAINATVETAIKVPS